jgi:hypothetical protein
MSFPGWSELAKEAEEFAIKRCFVANIGTPLHPPAL